MGYFTWTDANKQPRKTKSGDWRKSDIIQYGEYDNDALPYPLKVTARRDFVKYADLHPSYTTQ